ncbi:MAG: RDD family protein [Odoribacter sp.]|nr:RDD family protein [Odoribacter sp.]
MNPAQNVNVTCQPAGLVHRICATLLDYIFMAGAFLLILYFSRESNGYIARIFSVFLLCYHLLFEYLLKGQSPGKMICRIRVVRLDGQKLSFWECLLRWSLRLIDISISFGSIAMSSIIISSRMQRLGDLAAGTVVVREKTEVPHNRFTLYDTPEDYQVKFPQIAILTDKDISIIKEVMLEVEQHKDYKLLSPLASRVKTLTGIQTDMNNLTFMQTVLKDYIHLTKQ